MQSLPNMNTIGFVNEAFDKDKAKPASDQVAVIGKELDEKISEEESPNLFKEFCVNTSGHGFFKIIESQRRMKVVWISIMLSTTVGLLAHLILLLMRFFEHGVNSEYYISISSDMQMPDITMCPKTRFAFYEDIVTGMPSPVNPFIEEIFPGVPFMTLFTHYAFIWSQVVSTNTSNDLARYSIMKLSYSRQFLRHNQELVVRLHFRGQDADPAEMLPTPTIDGFLCTTYKPPIRSLNILTDASEIAMVLNTFYVGVDNSWEMATRSEQKSLIIRSGMDVYLHEADTMPDFNQIPDELNVGYLKYIAYNQVSKIRYPVNNRCFQDPAPIVVRGFQTGETKSYKFSRSLCIETQKADEVYRRCNCRSEILLISERVPDDTVFCHRIDDTLHTLYNASVAMGVFLRQSSMIPIVAKMRKRYECHQNTLNELRTETFPLHCVPSCVEHKYEYDKSVLVILRQSVQYNEIYNESMQLIISRFNETQRYRTAKMLQFISSSGLRYDLRYFISLISLVPKTLSVDTVEESLSYPLGSYFSDMGGVLGLYIGFSAITVLEIFELFIQHFSNKLCRGRTANA